MVLISLSISRREIKTISRLNERGGERRKENRGNNNDDIEEDTEEVRGVETEEEDEVCDSSAHTVCPKSLDPFSNLLYEP